MSFKETLQNTVYLVCCLLSFCGISYGAELEVAPSAGAVMPGKDEGPENRVLLRFVLPSSLDGARIDHAFLVLPVRKDSETTDAHPIRVTSLTSTSSFSSVALTYSDLETVDSLSSVLLLSDAAQESAKADVTEIVSQWVNSEHSEGSFVIGGLDGIGQGVFLTCVSPEDLEHTTKLVVRFTRVLAE